MKNYIKKFFLFLIPLALLLCFSFFVWLTSGEFVSFEKITEMQKEKELLIGKAYVPLLGRNLDENFKLSMFSIRQPDITTCGNSRILQFRQEFFKKDFTFYNTADTHKMTDLRDFLNNIPLGEEPEVIIVELDQSFFILGENQNKPKKDIEDTSEVFLRLWTKIYIDYAKGKFSLKDLFFSRGDYGYVGLNALAQKNGYKNDGSYYRGDEQLQASVDPDVKFADSFRQIEKEEGLFVYGLEPSVETIIELETFLKTAKERGIYVVAFLPPFAPSVYHKMMSFDNKYEYINKLFPVLSEIFKKYEYSVFNFTNAENIDLSDEEFIDGVHGFEEVALKMFTLMIQSDKVLARYAGDF